MFTIELAATTQDDEARAAMVRSKCVRTRVGKVLCSPDFVRNNQVGASDLTEPDGRASPEA